MKTLVKTTLFILAFSASHSILAQAKDTTFLVNGVCGMCERVIEKAAKMDGVESAEWDEDSKVLKLTYTPTEVSVEEISNSINQSGYDTQFSTAPDSAYYSLHACCYYRDPEVVKDHEEKKK